MGNYRIELEEVKVDRVLISEAYCLSSLIGVELKDMVKSYPQFKRDLVDNSNTQSSIAYAIGSR